MCNGKVMVECQQRERDVMIPGIERASLIASNVLAVKRGSRTSIEREVLDVKCTSEKSASTFIE